MSSTWSAWHCNMGSEVLGQWHICDLDIYSTHILSLLDPADVCPFLQCPTILASPTSWGLCSNLGFNSIASRKYFSGTSSGNMTLLYIVWPHKFFYRLFPSLPASFPLSLYFPSLSFSSEFTVFHPSPSDARELNSSSHALNVVFLF